MPEIRLAKRDWREFGVGTDCAEHHELFDPEKPRLLHQLQPHDGIIIEKLPGMLAIGADPPHHGRQVDYQAWASLFKQCDNGGLIPQVELAAAGDDDGWAPVRPD